MSCCGQTALQAQAAAHRTLDERTVGLTHVRLVYLGENKRTQPFVAAGKVYQFGDNERRRTNVVAQAALVKLLATGWFVVWDPERHNEDGSAKLTTSGTPRTDRETRGQGDQEPDLPPVTPSLSSGDPLLAAERALDPGARESLPVVVAQSQEKRAAAKGKGT